MSLRKYIKRNIELIKNKINKYKIIPTSVTIDISNRCNAACPFCSRQISLLKRNDLMSKEMFNEILLEISKIKTISNIVLAAWGEPLLHPNFDEFVDIIKEKGYKIGFPSNMSLADKHFDSMLKVNHIMFSVEGYDKESYEKSRKNLNFEKTFNNIVQFDNLIQQQKRMGEKVPIREINFLLTKGANIDQFINTWEPYVDIIRIGPVLTSIIWNNNTKTIDLVSNDELKENMIICNRKVEKMYCHQPFKSIIIRANGNLALCCSDYDINLDFGNYKNLCETFWNNKNLNSVRNEFKNHRLDLCKNCFQNFAVSKDDMHQFFPELEKFIDNPKIVIYSNR